jgi:hypothetical protein
MTVIVFLRGGSYLLQILETPLTMVFFVHAIVYHIQKPFTRENYG